VALVVRRAQAAWATVGRTFGAWLAPAGTAVLFLGLRALAAVGAALDPLLFPALRSTRVQAPIVLVGAPRTGTTFLHRFLHAHGVGASQPLWRMLYPSLVLQRLVRPFVPLLERISPARHHSTPAHQTGLTSVETDDASLMFRFFDGFFLYAFVLAFAEDDWRDHFDPRLRDTTARDFAFLRRSWARAQVTASGDRALGKLFSLGTRLPAFQAEFPDARVLYTVRDPVQTVPSTLSLVTGVLDRRFDFWALPAPVRERHLGRLYAGVLQLHQRFHEDWSSGAIDRTGVLVIPFERLMTDFDGAMDSILKHAGVAPTDAVQAAIDETAISQRSYQSPHQYDLQRFGLTAEQIQRDFAFVYEAFLDSPTPDARQP